MPTVPPDRAAALQALEDLEERGLSFDAALYRLDHTGLDDRGRRFARQLLFSVLRWQGRLDWIAERHSKRPVADLDPIARRLLRLGMCQLFFMRGVPPHAGVHATVELAKARSHRGIASLINALLRRAWKERAYLRYPAPDADPVAYLTVIHSHPAWLVRRWVERLGQAQATALLQANNRPAPLFVRACRDIDGFAERLQQEGFAAVPQELYPGFFLIEEADGLFASRAFAEGLFQVQDLSSSLAARLLAPTPGERVLDACSAPGGKTLQLAEAVGPQGRVLAADISPFRLRRLQKNAERLGQQNIQTVAASSCAGIEATFDRVLVDVPCSGTGTLGRRPDARWRKAADQLPQLQAVQTELLRQAFARLRPGGVMVYSTCSLESEENEAVVEAFLDGRADVALEEASAFFPSAPWAGRYINTLPGRDPGDGGFAARLRRV